MTTNLIGADLHCGAQTGLTPPEWQNPKSPFYPAQVELWEFFQRTVEEVKPDVATWNGDGIDGDQTKCGARGLITADPEEQALMYEKCVAQARARTNLFIAGTAYHTGKDGDWESLTAKEFDAELYSNLFYKIEGVTLNARHFVGRSTVPYGRTTAVTKENVWNLIKSEDGWEPRAQVFIRSHVHYFVYSGDARSLALTTPCLQLPGGLFGDRMCTGTVDVGLAWLVIDGPHFELKWRLFKPTSATAKKVLEVR